MQDIKGVESKSEALIVAGMHRSGTSLLASLLHRGGCPMGGTLLPADAQNLPGYFEDQEFLGLNRRMLEATVPADRPGHADWGWTEDMDRKGIEAGRLDSHIGEAEALVARRRASAAGGCWGWKDPRTSVLLDFWDARIEGARYVFVYRSPWDVADSMQRLGAPVFLRHPQFAYRIWHHYNRALVTFARKHRGRVLIMSAAAIVRAPQVVPELIRSVFGFELHPVAPSEGANPALLKAVDSSLARLAAAAHPECVELLAELEGIADEPAGASRTPVLVAAPRPPEPLITIVIPCFDQGEFLLDAIASVEHSVPEPYELLIVNDGSRERETLEILSVLRRARYRILDQDNRGLAHARNRGIAESRAGCVLPLDADNRLLPGFVEEALQALASDPSVMAVYGDRREFGLRTGRIPVGVPDLNRLLCGNYIDACAVIRVEALRACGGYDPGMPAQGAEDWDLWLSMLERGFTLRRLDMETFDYRVRPESMLSTMSDPETQTAIERYVLAKHSSLYLQQLRRQVDRLDQLDQLAPRTPSA